MRLPTLSFGLICAFLVSSCASIVSKSSYPVTISSNPNGATVTVTNSAGQAIHTATTPTTVTLNSSAGYFKAATYNLAFSMKGHASHTVQLHASLNGWYVGGNILFGGLIGWLIVDPATGAMWHLDDHVTTDMGAGVANAPSDSMSLKIVQRSAIPKEWESRLVAIH